MELGNAIQKTLKDARKHSGLSQSDVAEQYGCSTQFISKLENQSNDLSMSILLKLADIYELSPEGLMEQILLRLRSLKEPLKK